MLHSLKFRERGIKDVRERVVDSVSKLIELFNFPKALSFLVFNVLLMVATMPVMVPFCVGCSFVGVFKKVEVL